ncbi:MAG: DUF1611 domain-containing protein [Thermoplasmataceae archaeon]
MDNAVVLCEGFLGTTYGKTANGLVRFTDRFDIKAVLDSSKAGQDITTIISKAKASIKIISSMEEARKLGCDTAIVGVATDGGFLPENFRSLISQALKFGWKIVSGLHEFISDDPEFMKLAKEYNAEIVDVRKMFLNFKKFFTGKISEVKSTRIAVLGTDSAIGKRTTSVYLNREMNLKGKKAVMIGTGQTAWMQGFPYTIVIDSMINDFVAGGIEYQVVQAWEKEKPQFMFIEGQGSVLHPAYPGSFEIIGAARPDWIILQHAPKRLDYDGFEGIRIPPLEKYIKVLELISDRKVLAISLNREGIQDNEIEDELEKITNNSGIYAFDPLGDLSEISKIIGESINY